MKKVWELPSPASARRPEEIEFDGEAHLQRRSTSWASVGPPTRPISPRTLKVADKRHLRLERVRASTTSNPCERFCPAAVYEMVPRREQPETGKKDLFMHHENCVHCKTCDIADPYQIITWTTPEGGEGPDYSQM